MKKIFNKRCSVTAFDLKVFASQDGRDRGLWIGVADDSERYIDWCIKLRHNALDRFLDALKDKDLNTPAGRFSAGLTFGTYFDTQMPLRKFEMGLLEWDKLEKLHQAIGKELERRKALDE